MGEANFFFNILQNLNWDGFLHKKTAQRSASVVQMFERFGERNHSVKTMKSDTISQKNKK